MSSPSPGLAPDALTAAAYAMLHRNCFAVHGNDRRAASRERHASHHFSIRLAGSDYGGGRVGCRFPGQNQINTRIKTLAPRPTTCAAPKLPLFQAIQAKTAATARTTIINAKRNRLVVMAQDFGLYLGCIWVVDLLALGFVRPYVLVSELPYGVSQLPSKLVSVLMQVKRHHLRG